MNGTGMRDRRLVRSEMIGDSGATNQVETRDVARSNT